MKILFLKAIKQNILFYMTIAFIMSAIAIGFFLGTQELTAKFTSRFLIDFFISENSSRLIVAWILFFMTEEKFSKI